MTKASPKQPIDSSSSGSAPVACDLSVFEASERSAHGSDFELLVIGKAVSVRELDSGYVIEFPGEPQLFAKLASWIANESRCCPFFTFELRLEPRGGSVFLHISGPLGTKEMLAPELSRIGKSRG